ncbi:MAG: hypothetical protein NTY63_09125 [Candidatus Bipolaricaulota bacterium]|nr:hypothetical protein [Candidatus Bipolaricaulota bacterium]
MREGLVKREARDSRHDVDAPRRNADLEDRVVAFEILPREVVQRRAEAAKSPQDGLSVFARRRDPEVNVHGRARVAVSC